MANQNSIKISRKFTKAINEIMKLPIDKKVKIHPNLLHELEHSSDLSEKILKVLREESLSEYDLKKLASLSKFIKNIKLNIRGKKKQVLFLDVELNRKAKVLDVIKAIDGEKACLYYKKMFSVKDYEKYLFLTEHYFDIVFKDGYLLRYERYLENRNRWYLIDIIYEYYESVYMMESLFYHWIEPINYYKQPYRYLVAVWESEEEGTNINLDKAAYWCYYRIPVYNKMELAKLLRDLEEVYYFEPEYFRVLFVSFKISNIK